ncbi:unnamed protein product [Cuscuta campestris]|uniref:Protein kinase domain-containing protein n=1 Tax=Cuscuta campestris TaxID=132261 RepID=A0A484NLY1_9ASTE|nr:unnamed protein product [Cuscuta campestris]
MIRTAQLEDSLAVPVGILGIANTGFTPEAGFVGPAFTNALPLPRVVPDEGGGDDPSARGARKVKLMCSFGGKILPRPSDGALRYVGGQTRIIALRRDATFLEFVRKMAHACGQDAMTVKYQLPDEGLDALVSVSCPDDLENMMDEYEKFADTSAKLRVFLFPPSEADGIASVLQCGMTDKVRGGVTSSGTAPNLAITVAEPNSMVYASTAPLPNPIEKHVPVTAVLLKPEQTGFGLAQPGVTLPLQHSSYAPSDMPHTDYYAQQFPPQFFGDSGTVFAQQPLTTCPPVQQFVSCVPMAMPATPHYNSPNLGTDLAHSQQLSFESYSSGNTPSSQGYHRQLPAGMYSWNQVPHPQQAAISEGHVARPTAIGGQETSSIFEGSTTVDHTPTYDSLLWLDDKSRHICRGVTPGEGASEHAMAHVDHELGKVQANGGGRAGVYLNVPNPQHSNVSLPSGGVESHFSQILPMVPISCQVDPPKNLFVPLQHHVKVDVGSNQAFIEPNNSNDHLNQVEDRMGNLNLHTFGKHANDILTVDSILENTAQQVGWEQAFTDSNHITKTETAFLESLWVPEEGVISKPSSEGNPVPIISPRFELQEAQESSTSLFSNQDPWDMMQGDTHFPPPIPSKIRMEKETVGVKDHQSNMDSSEGSTDEVIKQELQAVAEDVAASVLQSSINSYSELYTKVQSADGVQTSDRNKLEKEKPKLPERRDFGFPVSGDIGHLQIIKNCDLEEFRELGSGTFGTVYHGKWRGTDVAIKRINDRCFAGKPSEEKRMRDDFWNEAIKLADLHHPNVVAFYGVVLDGPGGSVATVTEYMVNGSLRNALQKNGRSLDKWKRALIAMDVAFGMEYLHRKNIVHFDLKSDNLLVNLRDPHRPICKVGDLGLSKVKCQTLISGGVRGTLPWMAPELLNGSSNLVSEKVDVFSFGIVMWELLTGEEPYADLHYGAIIGGIVSNTLRPPVPESCGPEWRALMEGCWSPEPSERPSFTEVADQLRAIASKLRPKG